MQLKKTARIDWNSHHSDRKWPYPAAKSCCVQRRWNGSRKSEVSNSSGCRFYRFVSSAASVLLFILSSNHHRLPPPSFIHLPSNPIQFDDQQHWQIWRWNWIRICAEVEAGSHLWRHYHPDCDYYYCYYQHNGGWISLLLITTFFYIRRCAVLMAADRISRDPATPPTVWYFTSSRKIKAKTSELYKTKNKMLPSKQLATTKTTTTSTTSTTTQKIPLLLLGAK